MDRRKALKNMGLSLGYAVATPTLISIFQSCKTETVLEWTPDFFSKEEGSLITNLVDLILPKTDTPSASEVQVNIFIDRFANEVMEKEQQDFLKMTMKKFVDATLKSSGKETVNDLNAQDIEPVLAQALKVTKEEEKNYTKSIADYNISLKEGNSSELDDKTALFGFANSLRGLTIWGYKTSEYVGEEVLAYLPIPGEYKGCGDLEELTGGKAWSL